MLSIIYTKFNFITEKQFLLILGLFVISVFFVKAFLSFYAQKAVFKFGYKLKADLSRKLLKAYIEAPYNFHLRVNSATLIQNVIVTTDNVAIGAVMTLLTSICNAVIALSLILLLIKTSSIAIILIAALAPIVVGLVKLLRQ